ncbi:BC_2427 family protein [Lysinibacillus sp. NPDC094403]|uniref:BC_2427 family protein n=1 Tax=Lysinibacillus sp. NPDC094403 TaxID=3390581 RepID=UPI003D05B420
MKTPWINYREMKEISSKQKVFVYCNSLLTIEKENETSLAAHLDPDRELLITSEVDAEDEMNDLLDIEEVDETNSVEKQELVAHLDSACGLLIPSEIDVEDEKNNLLDIEEADETNSVEEQELSAHLGSDCELLIPSEIDVEDEKNNLLDIKTAEETNSVEEQELSAHLGSDCELLIPSEIDVENEKNNLLDIKTAEETNSVEKQELAVHLGSDCELLIPSEIDVEDEMNDLLNIKEVEGTNLVEDQDFASQLDSNLEFLSPSESNGEDEIMSPIDTEVLGKNNPAGHDSASTGSVQGKVCSITKKILISTHVEIDDFLHAPICGESVKNTFDFLDLDNHLTPQFETKLFSTTMDYPEQPDCRLVHSKINEIVFLMKTHTYDQHNQKSYPSKSVGMPLHNTQSFKQGKTNNHSYSSDDFMHIRVPVVVGEYKIEICLEENIVFEKGIVGIKDISNEVVLTNCKFVPNQFSQSLGNGTCSALKGNLYIEGYIHQGIEYTASHTRNVPEQNGSLIHVNQMCQNIVLELIIQMLQVQKIRVPRI